uniref:Uncharacterized protein n=1 Tax=Pristionchus pacificus TaxID=54126 RepID=A0A2A6B4W6_PRIPA|eukprot:PDM60901.1 hypothetical protein PRIPAC_54707 [Pristionchus pacificus]
MVIILIKDEVRKGVATCNCLENNINLREHKCTETEEVKMILRYEIQNNICLIHHVASKIAECASPMKRRDDC